MTNKIYSKQTIKGGLHWFFDTDDSHVTMRLAGKPSLLLEQYRKLYGDKGEGDDKYLELLGILKAIGDNGKSPFVFYINNKTTK